MQISAPVQKRRLLTLREAAEFLSVSERTVRRKIEHGEVPAYRLGPKGTSIRIPDDELEAWLESEPEAAA